MYDIYSTHAENKRVLKIIGRVFLDKTHVFFNGADVDIFWPV